MQQGSHIAFQDVVPAIALAALPEGELDSWTSGQEARKSVELVRLSYLVTRLPSLEYYLQISRQTPEEEQIVEESEVRF